MIMQHKATQWTVDAACALRHLVIFLCVVSFRFLLVSSLEVTKGLIHLCHLVFSLIVS